MALLEALIVGSGETTEHFTVGSVGRLKAPMQGVWEALSVGSVEAVSVGSVASLPPPLPVAGPAGQVPGPTLAPRSGGRHHLQGCSTSLRAPTGLTV